MAVLIKQALPQDNLNNTFLGLIDPATGNWTVWRARNVGAVTVAGQSTALADLGVVPVDAGGNAIVVSGGNLQVLVNAPLPAGTNALGTVGVTSLPALAAGTNAIGGVTTVGSATAIDDQVTATTTPTALPNHPCNEVQVQNDPFSAADLYIGSATGQHTHLQPGQSQSFRVTNTSALYVKTTAGTATVNLLARS